MPEPLKEPLTCGDTSSRSSLHSRRMVNTVIITAIALSSLCVWRALASKKQGPKKRRETVEARKSLLKRLFERLNLHKKTTSP